MIGNAPGVLRWLGVAAGIVALGGVLTLQAGDALLASGHQDAALALPGNSARAATLILPEWSTRAATPQGLALAGDALENSPLASEALTFLARDAQRKGDAPRGLRLLKLAGATGWHDETASRQLYNSAIRADDAVSALRHADALLRQARAQDELFDQFTRGAQIPRFRRALLPYVVQPRGWAQGWLAGHGARIADAPLAELLAARAKALGGLDRPVARPLTGGLIAAGRQQAARAAWRLVQGADGLAAGPLAWPQGDARDMPGPFDWQMGAGYRIESSAIAGSGTNGGDRLVAQSADPTARAARLIALPAGRWRLAVSTGEEAPGWLWSVSCTGQPPAPLLALGKGATFTVPARCPLQMLSLAVPMAGTVSPAPLPPLALGKVE